MREMLLIAAFGMTALGCHACGDNAAKPDSPTASWIGSSVWMGPRHSPPPPVSADVFDIDFIVVKGEGIVMEPTRNDVIWHVDGREVSEAPIIDEARYYLVASIVPGKKVPRLYGCTIKVVAGALSGRIVCIKPDGWVEYMRDPYYAVFEVPIGFRVDAGVIPFEVIECVGK